MSEESTLFYREVKGTRDQPEITIVAHSDGNLRLIIDTESEDNRCCINMAPVVMVSLLEDMLEALKKQRDYVYMSDHKTGKEYKFLYSDLPESFRDMLVCDRKKMALEQRAEARAES